MFFIKNVKKVSKKTFYILGCQKANSPLVLPCLAFSHARVVRIMNRRSPCRSVVHFSDCIFQLQSRP